METAVCRQPPSYRQAVVNQHQMTSRQTRPDMTSRDVYRVGSRGVDRGAPVPQLASVLQGRSFDEDRVRRLASPKVVDRNTGGTMYQRPAAWSSCGARPVTTAASCSLPRESSYGPAEDVAGSTATSRLFSAPSHQPQYHESSYSAPADCTAHRRPRTVPATAALLSCGQGVRAHKVSMRTAYHLTSTHRPTATSSSGQRSRSTSGSQQGSCLWVGVAQTIDIRPASATAITATVDCNNRELELLFQLNY